MKMVVILRRIVKDNGEVFEPGSYNFEIDEEGFPYAKKANGNIVYLETLEQYEDYEIEDMLF